MKEIRSLEIAGKRVGKNEPCFIIAEAGANFWISNDQNKNLAHALHLIDVASDAGADAVKFQVYRAKSMYVRDAGHADYLGTKKSIYDIIRDLELPYEWLPILKKHCENRKLIFFAAPFDIPSADELNKVGVEIFKIASYSITDLPLIRHIACLGKPIIISTGASDMDDVKRAIAWIRECRNENIIVMQCTAKYPAPLESLNLRTIPSMRDMIGIPVGLSDHSRDPLIAPLGAVALGACAIEKHFTTDNSLPGPDHSFAILPKELKSLVSSIRLMEKALGKVDKTIEPLEQELHGFARHFLYASKDILRGENIRSEHIAVLRPGKKAHGISPDDYDQVLGRIAKRNIREQEPITWESLS